MELPTVFFKYDADDSFGGIILFIRDIPTKIEYLIHKDTSNILKLIEDKKPDYFTSFHVEQAFHEMKVGFERSVFDYDTDEIFYKLKEAGLTGYNLRLKAGILNQLWYNLLSKARNFLDCTNKIILKELKKFLDFLNSFLGSIKHAVPFVEIGKEFKDCVEAIISSVTE